MKAVKFKGGLSIAIMTTVVLACASRAPAVEFTIDQQSSSLTLSGEALGSVPLQEQSSGSLTTTYQGTINAQIGSTIQFDIAVADADVSGDYLPDSIGNLNTAPGDYGAYAYYLLTDLYAAVREFIFDMNSAPITLTGNSFDASSITIITTQGYMDWNTAGAFGNDQGREDLAGNSNLNQASNGSLVIVGLDVTLTVPIDFTMYFDLSGDGQDDSWVNVTGDIVAMGTIPEPMSLLLLLGGAGFLASRRRLR
ncbi:MAG: PEP-CTERM sorting domain-containing protein [Actinobacteria bacterium]|nr:PEP-CTERM sorting domain-containing protein [Actinomycetota bacterium]